MASSVAGPSGTRSALRCKAKLDISTPNRVGLHSLISHASLLICYSDVKFGAVIGFTVARLNERYRDFATVIHSAHGLEQLQPQCAARLNRSCVRGANASLRLTDMPPRRPERTSYG